MNMEEDRVDKELFEKISRKKEELGNELVILNHAFTKKTQKTPKKEIKKAEQRKKEYFLQRRQG